jgi:DNA-binding NtrC family response regulator
VKKRILLLEDDPISRRNLSLFLESAAYDVYQAETAESGLEAMAGAKFDVVISDLSLSGQLSGLDVLKNSSGKRLILMTGFASNDVRAEAQRVGAVYLEKPISLDKLLSVLQQ